MKKLTYTNDQQLINDAAQMLIENHLSWSGSDTEMPSRDLDGVRGLISDAYLEYHYTADEWEEASKEERMLAEAAAGNLYRSAKQLADQKWEAVMTLLGF